MSELQIMCQCLRKVKERFRHHVICCLMCFKMFDWVMFTMRSFLLPLYLHANWLAVG